MLEPVAYISAKTDGGIVMVISNPLTAKVRSMFLEDAEAVAVYRVLHDYIQGGNDA
jgi:hypothetical protein